MTVATFPMLTLDANGLPRGHRAAHETAAKFLRDWINALPDSVYHLGRDDAEDVTTIMLAAYLGTLKQEQRR